MKRHIFLLALCTSVALGVMRTDLTGYVTNGPRWPTNEVTYFVNPNNISLSHSAVISAIQNGAAGWTEQSQANVRLVYAGQTNGSSLTLNNKNEVFFRNDANGGYGGETHWWYDYANRLIEFDIVFYEENYVFFSGSGCSGHGLYLDDLATHEFGHALGLAHSSSAGATMRATIPSYCDQSQHTLEADDINGIESLYPPAQVQPPNAPSQLAVAPSSSNPTSTLLLSWSDNANNENGYRVERSSDGTTFSQVAQIGANSESYTNNGLAAGTTYSYRVRAYNGDGNSPNSNIASGQTQASSQTNTPPAVTIANPLNGSSYPADVAISFSGAATDAQDGNLTSGIVWTSSVAGQIGTGGSFTRTLAAGTHVITARATDGGSLSGSLQVTVTVTASSNTAPSVSISSPSNNASFAQGASISFSGSATDSQSGNLSSAMVWTSSIAGQIGTGGSFTTTLSGGTHVITARVTDSGGLSASRHVTVTVNPSSAPSTVPTLTVRGYKVKGQKMADLTWRGLSSSTVDIFLNGARLITTANDGSYTDEFDEKGNASATYKVCAAGTSTCSNQVTPSFN